MRRTRLVDVAAAAEVSRATVTNALNGTGRMSAATRTRVRAVAADLGYRTAPRTLALSVTARGGLQWDFLSVHYYAAMVNAATAAAHRLGYGLTILPAGITAWDVPAATGALILDSPAEDRLAEQAAQAALPLAFVGRPADMRTAGWVDNDHAGSVRTVLDHLAGQGARRIALMAGDCTDHYTRACVAAYRDWCRENSGYERVAAFEFGRDTAGELLGGPGRPDAVYGIYEDMGRQLLAAADRNGLRVPDDVLVACFSEDPSYALTTPPVTTVSHTPQAGGRLAVEGLVRMIEGGVRQRPTVVPTRLVVRASTLRNRPDGERRRPGLSASPP
ncbi:LacI family DNA-binding transcriptional regulator [Yinghuangia soli]|uniref:LacI family transcriptional regulator n=1 Tax=Yinghuangia soli TaxID=2908204 RepID=A0AA41Q658_9ACTN|nr:LacI family DNA-binding transcriptional regulator [Yinghuangia soli]MCF2530892.1 LacI family transcriptional regulator [Yinghuangia soli]